jgi:NAD(P)-dependent dehydrogenase (short-subunit alcohol dehydrogenase family)
MRTLVATGVTDGVGRAVMEGLFREEPFTAVLVGRSRDKLDGLVDELAKISRASRFDIEVADLSFVAEVRALAQRILARHEPLDLLFQSAGTVPARLELTNEGIERSLAVSFVCRAQLYHELKPMLLAAENPLVFHVPSPGQNGKVYVDDLNLTKGFRATRSLLRHAQEGWNFLDGPLHEFIEAVLAHNNAWAITSTAVQRMSFFKTWISLRRMEPGK